MHLAWTESLPLSLFISEAVVTTLYLTQGHPERIESIEELVWLNNQHS